MNTRKYPRTLDEAFGSKEYCEPVERPIDAPDRIVLWACAAAVVAVVVMAVWGWLS